MISSLTSLLFEEYMVNSVSVTFSKGDNIILLSIPLSTTTRHLNSAWRSHVCIVMRYKAEEGFDKVNISNMVEAAGVIGRPLKEELI